MAFTELSLVPSNLHDIIGCLISSQLFKLMEGVVGRGLSFDICYLPIK